MKILNLFAGIGGNRTKWGDTHEITAVEFDPDIAMIYQKRFPNDTVVVGDALEYVWTYYKKFEFIWASPPCQTNTRLVIANWGNRGKIPQIPNMDQTYGLITWLSTVFDGNWVVENVIPYYKPLIIPSVKLGRHLFWSNFPIPGKEFFYDREPISKITLEKLAETRNIEIGWLKSFKIKNWTKKHDVYRTILRNCVDARIGRYILNCSTRPIQQTLNITSEEKRK